MLVYRHFGVVSGCCFGVQNLVIERENLEEAGFGDSFGAPLHLELAKDSTVVSFHSACFRSLQQARQQFHCLIHEACKLLW